MPNCAENTRDLQKHLWKLPIPEYDAMAARHRELAEAGAAAAGVAAGGARRGADGDGDPPGTSGLAAGVPGGRGGGAGHGVPAGGVRCCGVRLTPEACAAPPEGPVMGRIAVRGWAATQRELLGL